MKDSPLRILLVEDNPGDAGIIEELLRGKPHLRVAWVDRLARAFELLDGEQCPDVVLLDLSLPDSRGLETLDKMAAKAPRLPIVVLTGLDDNIIGIAAVRKGAQDYLVKGQIDERNLVRSLLYAVQRKQAEEELKESRLRFRNLWAHLLDSREEERANVSLRVHDDMAQVLVALKMDLCWIAGRLAESQIGLKEKLDEDIGIVDSLMRTASGIWADLGVEVLEHLGLADALSLYAAEFDKRTGIPCDVLIGRGVSDPEKPVRLTLFRISQEALANVQRHAEATTAQISLTRQEGTLTLTVRDDGKGISPEALSSPHSFGLVDIRERCKAAGGTVEMEGWPGRGTVITVRVPLKGSEKMANQDKVEEKD